MVIHCRLFLRICQGVCWVIDRIALLVAKLLVPPRYFALVVCGGSLSESRSQNLPFPKFGSRGLLYFIRWSMKIRCNNRFSAPAQEADVWEISTLTALYRRER